MSGHYSDANFGLLAGGWGGFALAALVPRHDLGLVFCIAEIGVALPYRSRLSFAFAASLGPWGGFVTGLCNVNRLTPPSSFPSSPRISPPSTRRRPGSA